MTDKFRYNNRSVLVTRRVRALFNKISREQDLRTRLDIHESTQNILTSFRELFSNLGKPSVEINPFESKQVPRSKQINKTMAQIEDDLEAAYDEMGGLREGLVETFNHAQALSADLITSADEIGSKVVDLRLLNDQLDQNVLVAGDDFRTLARVDQSIGLQNPAADILLDQGVVVLNRSSSINLVNENTHIDVTPVGPKNLKRTPTLNNVGRFYEGDFYDFVGQARPEGGRYHLEQSMSVNVEPEGQNTETTVTNNFGGSTPATFEKTVDNRLKAEGIPQPGERLRPEDIIVYDRGASEGELATVRANLIDENPASFWECEYVRTSADIQNIVDQSKLIGLDTESQIAGTLQGREQGAITTVTLDDLRNEARADSSGTNDDLIIDITVTLDSAKTVNWLSLIPNNFEDTAWIDVLDISYANSGTTSFQTVPGFSNSIHDNVITDEANAELTDSEAGALLAPSKYAYRGIGVWSFEPVEAKSLRFRLRQRTAVPDPYQRLAIRLHRVFTQVYTTQDADTPGI